MTKMTIYHVIVNSDHPVPVTANIDLRYPLASCIHTGRGIWQVIDLETGLSFGRTSDTLKECGPIIAQFYDKVQEIKKNPKKLVQLDGPQSRGGPEDDRGRQQYQAL